MKPFIQFSKKFKKQYKKLPHNIKKSFDFRLEIFIKNQFNSSLNNHKLKGKFLGCNSINITGDCRAIYEKLDSGEIIFFLMIGTHSELYK